MLVYEEVIGLSAHCFCVFGVIYGCSKFMGEAILTQGTFDLIIILCVHEIKLSECLYFLRKYLIVQRQYRTKKRSSLTFSLEKARLIFATCMSCLCLCNKEKRSETCQVSKLASPLRDEGGGTAQKLKSDSLGKTAE